MHSIVSSNTVGDHDHWGVDVEGDVLFRRVSYAVLNATNMFVK
jgi:hypothetical protein